MWYGKAGELDGARDTLSVDERIAGETLNHNSLGAEHVPGCQVSIRGAARYRYRVARGVDYLAVPAIAGTLPAQVPNIVRQGGDNEVQPIVLGYISAQAESAQDVLSHQSYQRGVLRIVIKRIA